MHFGSFFFVLEKKFLALKKKYFFFFLKTKKKRKKNQAGKKFLSRKKKENSFFFQKKKRKKKHMDKFVIQGKKKRKISRLRLSVERGYDMLSIDEEVIKCVVEGCINCFKLRLDFPVTNGHCEPGLFQKRLRELELMDILENVMEHGANHSYSSKCSLRAVQMCELPKTKIRKHKRMVKTIQRHAEYMNAVMNFDVEKSWVFNSTHFWVGYHSCACVCFVDLIPRKEHYGPTVSADADYFVYSNCTLVDEHCGWIAQGFLAHCEYSTNVVHKYKRGRKKMKIGLFAPLRKDFGQLGWQQLHVKWAVQEISQNSKDMCGELETSTAECSNSQELDTQLTKVTQLGYKKQKTFKYTIKELKWVECDLKDIWLEIDRVNRVMSPFHVCITGSRNVDDFHKSALQSFFYTN